MANTYINSSKNAALTMSVEDFIALSSTDEITYYNYSILEYLNGYEMFVSSILYDYAEEIEENTVTLELTDEEKRKYRYKPYLLAYDVYGSTECKFILMMLNGIIDPKEFDLTYVKVLYRSTLNDILGHITPVNENFLNKNRTKLKADFKAGEGNTIWVEDSDDE